MNLRKTPRSRAILLAFGAGLLLRLFFFFRLSHIAGDALVYGDIAHNLLQHHVYGFTNGPLAGTPVRPTLIRLPGYPLFLLLCFRVFGDGRYIPVLLLQIVIDLGTCALMAGLAGRLFGRRAGLAALWLAALCPFSANYTAAPLTETLTLFCIALAFFSLERWDRAAEFLNRWLVVLAGALAYAILLRPEQGILAAAVVPAVLWLSWGKPDPASRRLAPAVLVSMLTLLPLVPWAARNEHTFHVFEPLAPRFANDPGEGNPYGFQRWYRTWAIDFASTDNVYWNYDGSPISVADLPNRAFDTQAQYAATEALLERYNDNNAATPALDASFNTIASERVHANPIRYFVALPVARVLNMAFRPRTDMLPVPDQWWKVRGGLWRATLFALFYAAINLAYFILAALTVSRRRQWKPHAAIVLSMLATIALRSALLLTLDNSEPRYTLEFFPVLIVLGAACWARPYFPQGLPPKA